MPVVNRVWGPRLLFGFLWACLLAGPTGAYENTSPVLPRLALLALESESMDTQPAPVPGSTRNASMYKAALLSALLPGLGEYYSGHSNRALLSGTAEAALWTSVIVFNVQEGLRADRALEYAVAYAGAHAPGNDDYFKAVGRFLRNEGPGMWNEFVRRSARDTGEIVGREYTGEESWAWTSRERFDEYRALRRDKLHAGENATDALALLVVNRIVSIVSVVQAVRSDARHDPEDGFGLELEIGASLVQPRARIGVWNRF